MEEDNIDIEKQKDVESPTIQQETLRILILIDAKEGRDVAIAGVMIVYLLALMDYCV